jgi:hypothetical protein
MIKNIKTRLRISYRRIALHVGIAYATLMRWIRRISSGREPVKKPGPKKVEPLDLALLKQSIGSLDHGSKRTAGTGSLHRAFGGAISRRELDDLISQSRIEENQRLAAARCHVTWLYPNLAWAIDGCELKMDGDKINLQTLSDLCSRYKLPPLVTDHVPCGQEICWHLARLFTRMGPPLFVKRDNGSNLNQTAVDQVLADALVIPINSPANRASYNGAIERTQGEFKSYLRRWGWKAKSKEQARLLVETAAHDLNHRHRRSLSGKMACRVYFGKNRLRYTRRKREAAYQWIKELAQRISSTIGDDMITPSSWRVAARHWLLKNRMIRIVRAGKVLPYFSLDLCHN